MNKLKPCPFCGNEAHIGGDENPAYGLYIACDVCYCAVGEGYDRDAMPDHCFTSEEEAIKAWNTRDK